MLAPVSRCLYLSAGTLESWTGSEEAKAWSKVGAETWEYLMAKAGA